MRPVLVARVVDADADADADADERSFFEVSVGEMHQMRVCSDSRKSRTLRRFGRDESVEKLRSKCPMDVSFKMLL